METSIYALIMNSAHQDADAIAVTAPDRTPLTYGALQQQVEYVVSTLNAWGISRNDRVAVVLPNGPDMAVAFVAIASGATVLSHVNDSGFWLVSRYLGMTEKQTLRVWTVMETLVGLTGFGVVLLISFFL